MLTETAALLKLLFLLLLQSPSQSSGDALDQSNVIVIIEDTGYPSQIRLEAGVIHAPPFAVIEETEDQKPSFSGYQIDLLERLKHFAAEDGVDLIVELSMSPPQTYADSFNLLAKDCNSTTNPNPLNECKRFDMIVGDYYSTSERYMRADLSPPWLKTSMTTIKWTDKEEGFEDYTTLADAEAGRATVCVPSRTYLSTAVMAKFPNANYIECNAADGECISHLKSGDCVLFAEDELLLQYKASQDPSLEVTREAFNSQFLVWPLREDLPSSTSKLLKTWMYKAVEDAVVDDLYFQHFQREKCPHGTAGENCEKKCDATHGAADSHGVCQCVSTRWTGEDCSIEVMEDLNLLPQSMVISCYLMAAINFVLVGVCAMWLWLKRHKAQVKMSQPMFLVVILIGCVISTSTIFALAQEDEGDGPVHACAAIPWLYSVGFSLTFGALFARIRRVHILLQSAIQMRRITISAKETMLSIAVVLAVDVVILLVWTIVDPMQWTRTTTDADLFGEPLESEGHCRSDHWKIFGGMISIFHLCLMIRACNMCYKARKIPDRISQSKWIALAMFSNLQIFLISVPLLVIFGSDPATTFFVRSAAIWINDFAVINFVFGSLIYRVQHNDKILGSGPGKMSSHISLTNDIQAYAKKTRERADSNSEIVNFNSTQSSQAHSDRQSSSDVSDISEGDLTDVENKQSQSSSNADTRSSPNQNLAMVSTPMMLKDLSKVSERDRISGVAGDDNLCYSSRDNVPSMLAGAVELGSKDSRNDVPSWTDEFGIHD